MIYRPPQPVRFLSNMVLVVIEQHVEWMPIALDICGGEDLTVIDCHPQQQKRLGRI